MEMKAFVQISTEIPVKTSIDIRSFARSTVNIHGLTVNMGSGGERQEGEGEV